MNEENKTWVKDEYRKYLVLSLRAFQILCIGCLITGAIWASSDLMLTILVELPITPISSLLMLYGTFGTLCIEATIRIFIKKSKKKQT